MTDSRETRIAFAGTPAFAVPSLQRLIDSDWRVDIVLTQPDRPVGRGRRLQSSAVKQLAEAHAIEVFQPERLDDASRAYLSARRPTLFVVVAYGLILPQWMLDWPSVAAVNVHASLLPRWRGAAPIQHAVLAGDAETGVSIMQIERGLDTGPVYARRATEIGAHETAGELHDRLAVIGGDLLAEMLPQLLAGDLVPERQVDADSCYAPKIDKRDAILDFSQPASALARRVLAFNPWPVAEARTASGERLRIWRAQAIDAAAVAEPGTVIATGTAGIDVATGQGCLRLLEVQPANGRVMSAAAYLTAHALEGTRFASAG